ncbi:MAG: translocation/assembly module TamB domain-containing protein, partial [Bryobacteraceae bacterium]|nr:translocation/assembly module TamB domain-containing protein [Bryobacteraceae bacterium]
DISFNARTLRLTGLEVRKPSGGVLKGDASYHLDDQRYRLSAQGAGILIEGMRLPSGDTLRASASLKVSGDGTPGNRQLDATLSATNVNWSGNAVGTIEADANLLGEGLTINLRLPEYNATALTRMSTEAPYPATIQARLEATDLSRLPLPQPVRGSLTASVEAAGDFDRWQDGQAKGVIEALVVERGGLQIRAAAPAAFSLLRRSIRIEPLKLMSSDSAVTLSGNMPDGIRLQGELTSADTTKLMTAFSTIPPVEATGKAQWDLTLKGPWKQFTLEGSFDIQAESVRAADVGELTAIDAHAEIRQGAVHIDKLSAKLGESAIIGSGSLPLSLAVPAGWLAAAPATGPGRLRVEWDKVEIASLLRQKDSKLTGSVSGQADLEIAGLTARDVAGRITLTPLNLNVGTLAFALEQPANLSLRNGVARVDQFRLKGTAGTLALSGEAGLLAPQPVRLKVEGVLDAALIGAFSDQLTAAGETKLEVAATGTIAQPALAGFLEFPRLDATVPSMDMQFDGVKARIVFEGDKITLAHLAGTLNGGALAGGGGLRMVNGAPQDVNLNFTASNVYLQYPRDLKTLFNAAIGLRSAGAQYVLNGDVQILEGSYDEDINLDEFVLRNVNEVTAGEEEKNGLLRRLRLNVTLRTASPILIKNNLAETAISADLRAVGSPEKPGLTGRLTLEEGGQIRLNERDYLIERGVVTFTDERRIKPSLDLLARTQVSGHDITLQVQGEQGELKSTLISDPPLPEADVVSLLVTGRTLDRLAGAETEATKEQVLSYLATRVGGQLTRSVERTFGISQVRIQPNLIAPESDPGARLTVGQDITPAVRLTYSMDLARSSDQFWLGEWDLTRRFRVRGLKDFDNTYRFEFRHEVQFGSIGSLVVDQARAPIRRLGAIVFGGNFYLSDKELASRLKLKPAGKHDFFAVRKAVTRLQNAYWSNGFHEARIRTDRDIRDSIVDLKFGITEGPRVKIVYEGWNPPGSVRKEVLRIWEQGGFDTGRVLKATAELRTALLADGYLAPLVAHQIRQPDEQNKQVVFEIHPNVRYPNPEMVIEGASKIPLKRLRRTIASHRPGTDIYLRPQRVADSLRRLYRQEGYLEATVSTPRLETDAQTHTARFVMKVDEGARFSVAAIAFTGNEVYSQAELAAGLRLQAGQVYLDEGVESAVQDLITLYSEIGFNDAEIETTVRRDSAKGTVDVEFQIAEQRQSVLEELTLTGNRRTSRGMVQSQAGLVPGDIINPRKFSEARRNLYQTGAFSLVDIETEEIGSGDQVKRLRAKINVRELTPFALKYGGYYETDRGPGAIFDFVTRNFLRAARVAGVRGRYDSRFQEIRGYFSQPLLRRFPVGTTSTVFVRREVRDAFIAERVGFSVVQESRFRERWILNYGYRMERTHTFEREPDPLFPFDITLRVAPLQASLTHDNRDDILDATRGSFLSQSVEYAPEVLGSQLQFVRYYGQYFRYQALSRPAEIPWSGGARRPRVIYAGAVRAGVASGLGGQELVASERFFAGGGTSVRGFRQDHVGPVDFRGDPEGGDAMFVTNHELRFPAFSILDGVAFVDAGNVFSRARDLRPWDLRTAAGMGVRIRTPYFLFRLDYGFNLNPKPGEDRGRFFFSIGQAF